MIGVQSTVKDDVGTIWIRNYQDSGGYSSKARIFRQKTLDGGSVFSHLGVSVTDRDFLIKCRLSPEEAENIKALYQAGSELMVSFWEGSFLGIVAELDIDRDGEAQILFYFKEKLT